MRHRCENPNHQKGALYYQSKGIKVCERWTIFENFLGDMGPRPPGTTLDRWPDRNGNYEPGNCRWATIEEQNNNRAGNVRITACGETLTIAEWSARLGIGHSTLLRRVKIAGESGEHALRPVEPVTVCKRGHPFDEANTYWSPGGRRGCRACARMHSVAYEAKRPRPRVTPSRDQFGRVKVQR